MSRLRDLLERGFKPGTRRTWGKFEYEKQTNGEWRRVDSKSPATPKVELPEDPWRYFQKVPGSVMVNVKDLQTIRARPEGIEHAEKYMRQAFDGGGTKRVPITVVRKVNGKYKVVDGNSTTAIAKRHGWKKIPVTLA